MAPVNRQKLGTTGERDVEGGRSSVATAWRGTRGGSSLLCNLDKDPSRGEPSLPFAFVPDVSADTSILHVFGFPGLTDRARRDQAGHGCSVSVDHGEPVAVDYLLRRLRVFAQADARLTASDA